MTLEGPISQVEGICTKLAQRWSGEGEYWVAATPPLTSGLREICTLREPNGETIAIVEDSGSASYASTICGSLTHKGWSLDTEGPSIGPQQQAYEEAHRAEEAAEARAAQAREQAAAQEEQARQKKQAAEESCEKAAEAAEHREDAHFKAQEESSELTSEQASEREASASSRESEAYGRCSQGG